MNNCVEVAIAVIKRIGQDGKAEYLIAQRKGRQAFGKWEFPGGKRKKREDIKSCCYREIKEELRVGIAGEEFLVFEYIYNGRKYLFTCFLCEVVSGTVRGISLRAHLAFAWAKPEDFKKYEFMEADQKIAEVLSSPPVRI